MRIAGSSGRVVGWCMDCRYAITSSMVANKRPPGPWNLIAFICVIIPTPSHIMLGDGGGGGGGGGS